MLFVSSRFKGNLRLANAGDNSPVMKLGEIGHPVRLVQQALLDVGLKLPVSTKKYGSPDGRYGGETKRVVRRFQIEEKLPDKDGIVGHDTLKRLDTMLKGRPYTALPPLPDLGGEDNPDDNARQRVIEALTGMPTMTLHIVRTELTEDEGSRSRTPKRFSASITSDSYGKVVEAVRDGSIDVIVDPAISAAAAYSPYKTARMPYKNTIVFGREPTGSISDRAKIIHEATHAAHDIRGVHMDRIVGEAVAVLAEAWFLQKRTGRPKAGLKGDSKRTYELADQVVTFIRRGKDHARGELTFAGKKHKFDDVFTSFLVLVRKEYGRGTFSFDGI